MPSRFRPTTCLRRLEPVKETEPISLENYFDVHNAIRKKNSWYTVCKSENGVSLWSYRGERVESFILKWRAFQRTGRSISGTMDNDWGPGLDPSGPRTPPSVLSGRILRNSPVGWLRRNPGSLEICPRVNPRRAPVPYLLLSVFSSFFNPRGYYSGYHYYFKVPPCAVPGKKSAPTLPAWDPRG